MMAPQREIGVGFVLVVAGVALPLLMVVGTLRATFALCAVAVAASVGGLLLGFIGSARYRRARDRDGR